jgi:hypothetical protein
MQKPSCEKVTDLTELVPVLKRYNDSCTHLSEIRGIGSIINNFVPNIRNINIQLIPIKSPVENILLLHLKIQVIDIDLI